MKFPEEWKENLKLIRAVKTHGGFPCVAISFGIPVVFSPLGCRQHISEKRWSSFVKWCFKQPMPAPTEDGYYYARRNTIDVLHPVWVTGSGGVLEFGLNKYFEKSDIIEWGDRIPDRRSNHGG
jgi:hypothetical protein